MAVSNGQTTAAPDPSQSKTDPTQLTTEALLREVEIINKDLDRRFGFYDRLLNDSDRQRVEQKADTKAAVDAALAAAKEAVKEQTAATKEAIGKSETMFYSTLENMKETVRSLEKFRDTAIGRQAAITGGGIFVFAIVTVALRFL